MVTLNRAGMRNFTFNLAILAAESVENSHVEPRNIKRVAIRKRTPAPAGGPFDGRDFPEPGRGQLALVSGRLEAHGLSDVIII